MEKFRIRDDFIKLGQALKATGLCETGSQAKDVITGGEVLVNGEEETRRGRKLYPGDHFTFMGKTVEIEGNL